MTKNVMQIIDNLISNTDLHSTELYNYYDRVKNIDGTEVEKSPKLLFEFLDEIDDLILDNVFLTENAQLLNVRRPDIQEVLCGLCEILGEKIEALAKEVFVVQENNNYIVYCNEDNREKVINKLLYTNYSKMVLSEERKIIKTDWYQLYTWRIE